MKKSETIMHPIFKFYFIFGMILFIGVSYVGKGLVFYNLISLIISIFLLCIFSLIFSIIFTSRFLKRNFVIVFMNSKSRDNFYDLLSLEFKNFGYMIVRKLETNTILCDAISHPLWFTKPYGELSITQNDLQLNISGPQYIIESIYYTKRLYKGIEYKLGPIQNNKF